MTKNNKPEGILSFLKIKNKKTKMTFSLKSNQIESNTIIKSRNLNPKTHIKDKTNQTFLGLSDSQRLINR